MLMNIQVISDVIKYMNKYVIGQDYPKKVLATILTNHYNSQLLEYSDKITKTVLLQGPPGTGKTLSIRTVSRYFQIPYVHISALSLFNSIQSGNVNTFLEQVMNKLIEVVIRNRTRYWKAKYTPNAKTLAQERVIEVISQLYNIELAECRKKFEEGEYDDIVIPVQVQNNKEQIMIHLPASDAINFMIEKELIRLLSMHDFTHEALEYAQKNSLLVFDNIDKLCVHHMNSMGGNVSKELEFAQHVLVQLIDGMSILTKYGPIHTNEMLLIMSGAFLNSNAEQFSPELLARISRSVSFQQFNQYDMLRILTDADDSILQQYLRLADSMNLQLEIEQDAIIFLCERAYELNEKSQNFGIRRLYSMIDAILQPIFQTNDPNIKTKISIDKDYISMFFDKPIEKNDTQKYVL